MLHNVSFAAPCGAHVVVVFFDPELSVLAVFANLGDTNDGAMADR